MVGANHSNKVGYLLAHDGLPAKHEGRDDFLPNATAEALKFFGQSDEPFFLMVEGSQIDWGGHANNGDYVIQEVLDFDKTIGVALDYAEKHGNTARCLLPLTMKSEVFRYREMANPRQAMER